MLPAFSTAHQLLSPPLSRLLIILLCGSWGLGREVKYLLTLPLRRFAVVEKRKRHFATSLAAATCVISSSGY
jgi:hypothetical protein